MRYGPALLLVLIGGAAAQDDASPESIINRHFEARWREAGVKPGPTADGYVFYRRASLDITGRVPHRDDVRRFASARNRARLVDDMLASPRAAEFFADLWLQWLNDHEVSFDDQARCEFGALHDWLEGAWRKDMPYDAFVRALLSERGGKRDVPTVNFLLKHVRLGEPPALMAAHAARLFLGRDIRCAQCHDDPFGRTTHEDFWRFAAFFRPVRETAEGLVEAAARAGPPREDLGERGEPAAFLDGRRPAEGRSLGEELAEFVVTTSGHEHARTLVERYWKHFFGRPLGREQSELREALVGDFVAHGQNLRRLVRAIVMSKPYQLASEGKPESRAAYAAGPLKLMSSVQFLNAYMIIFQLERHYQEVFARESSDGRARSVFRDPTNMRLSFYRWGRDMMFGRGKNPEDVNASVTLSLALRFANNRHVQQMIVASYGLVRKILAEKSTPEGRTEDFFLSAIGRPPTEAERERVVGYAKASESQQRAFEDVLWALVNSGEFIFIR